MTATSATTTTRTRSSLPVGLVISGLLVLLGIAAWIVQLNRGMSATALTNLSVWGIYIAGFITFMGLSAGSLVLAALPLIFPLPRFRPYARLAAFIALISLVAAGLFILVDIGHPERLWRIVRFGRLGSPLLWDLLLTVAYLIVATVFLRRLSTTKSDAELRPLAWLALLAGLADGLTGFVFATQVAHEFWFSAVQPMAFFVAAVTSAAALLLLLAVLLKAQGYTVPEYCDLVPVSALTAAGLVVGLLLTASEVITLAFTRSATALELVNHMVGSPVFWLEVAAAVLAIIFLALPALAAQREYAALGAVLALASLALKRFVFVQMGFAVPNIDLPGVAIAPSAAYVPNLIEWGVTLGLVGLFAFLLLLGIRSLRLVEANKG